MACYIDRKRVGNPFGDPVKLIDTSKPYRFVTALRFWKNKTVQKGYVTFAGIQVVYNDGTSYIEGKTSNVGPSKSISFKQGEKVRKLGVEDSEHNSGRWYFALVDIETTEGESLYWGWESSKNGKYHINIGEGNLVGLTATLTPEGFTSIEFWFLKAVESVHIKIDTPPPDVQQIVPVLQSSRDFGPAGKDGEQWEYTDGVERTKTSSFSQSTTQTSTVSISIEATFFDVVKTSLGYQFQESRGTVHAAETSETLKMGWSLSGTLNRGQMVTVKSILATADLRLPYTSRITLRLKDGTQYAYDEGGMAEHVLFGGGHIVAEYDPEE